MPRMISENEKRAKKANTVRERQVQQAMKNAGLTREEAVAIVAALEEAQDIAKITQFARLAGLNPKEQMIRNTEQQAIRALLANPVVKKVLQSHAEGRAFLSKYVDHDEIKAAIAHAHKVARDPKLAKQVNKVGLREYAQQQYTTAAAREEFCCTLMEISHQA